ncbi:hypothetical protein MJI46_31960, partial [Salmonella enterica subsp. enterica serovar Cerro]|nr:hypothetical protein [Salmonella enterica subsp. enterica serovar Cerro]
GVYSADPRKVKDACLLPLLRLDEASELARLAAPVLHARTLQPDSRLDVIAVISRIRPACSGDSSTVFSASVSPVGERYSTLRSSA